MSPFTGSDRECISSLAMATSPSCSFSWGEITSIVSPSLVTSEPASSTTTFGCSLLCPTLRLHNTPTSHANRTVLLHRTSPDIPSQPDHRPIIVQSHQGPTPTTRSQKGRSPTKSDPVIPKYIKRLCSKTGPASATLCRHFKFTSYL